MPVMDTVEARSPLPYTKRPAGGVDTATWYLRAARCRTRRTSGEYA